MMSFDERSTHFKHVFADAIRRGTDTFFATLALLAIPTIVSLIVRGRPFWSIVAFDVAGIPWGDVWEFLEGAGAIGAAARGAYWAVRKITGHDKYFAAIWAVLDDAPRPLPKDVIKKKAFDHVIDRHPSEKERFGSRFEKTWSQMRQSGVVVKDDAEGEEALFKLKEGD